MSRLTLMLLAILTVVSVAQGAFAQPRLQTYIVDSDYHYNYSMIDRRSWVSNTSDFDLKVVGYWGATSTDAYSLTGAAAPAYQSLNCYLAISVPWNQSGTVYINGVEITSFTRYRDALPSGVRPAWYLRYTTPSLLGKFNFYNIGTIDNDQVGAWHYDHGMIHTPGWGDEVMLDVVVRGFDWAHFDAVGVDARGRTYTNPYDYDSSYFSTPEPGTLSLVGIGLIGIALLRKKRG